MLKDTERQKPQFASWDTEKQTLACDLDGTLCPHEWIDEETIVTPFEGALEFIIELHKKYNIVIFSARATRPLGKIAICNWLIRHGLSQFVCDVTNQKMYSYYRYIDDRAIVFKEPNDYNKILKELNCES